MKKSLFAFLAFVFLLPPLIISASGLRSGGGAAGNVSNSGTPVLHQWSIWYDATRIKGVAVTANKVACTDANGEPTACANLLDISIPTVPAASTTTPLMDGSANYGGGTTWARADHVHPADTSKAPVTNPAMATNAPLTAGSGSGFTIAGSTLTLGSVYFYGTSGLALAKADNAATTPAICVASTASACTYSGTYKFAATQSWTVGGALYLSNSVAGGLTQTAPTTSAHLVQRVGIAIAADTVLMMPSLDVGTIQ